MADALDKFSFEVWSQEEANLYWEWCDVWYEQDFDWENELTPDGEEVLNKAERIGPPEDPEHPTDYTESPDTFQW